MSVAQLVSAPALMEGNEVNVPSHNCLLANAEDFLIRFPSVKSISAFCRVIRKIELHSQLTAGVPGDSSLPWKLHVNIESVSVGDKWLALNHQVVYNQW
jgi:hypothetical protein